jgi:uncharacterized protein
MTSAKTLLGRHPLPVYFGLTFGISWGGALVAIGGEGGISGPAPAADPRFVYAVLAMLAGPSVTGILLTVLIAGREGFHDLRRRALRAQVAVRWHAVALLAAPLLWVSTLVALSLISSAFLPGIITAPDKMGLVLIGSAVALGAGVFEEIGWTGFATPHLRRRYGVVATGLIMGVLWGAWHLLTNVFWAVGATAGELPLSIFVPASVTGVLFGYLAAFRVLMVWLYERTGSVFLAMVMHASLTASVMILDPSGLSGTALLTYALALAAVVWAAVALVGSRYGWHLAQSPLREIRRAA